MNIEDLAQPPKPPEEQAEFDRALNQRLQNAVEKWRGTALANVPGAKFEPAVDVGADRRRKQLEDAKAEGLREGIAITVALIREKGIIEALTILEAMFDSAKGNG